MSWIEERLEQQKGKAALTLPEKPKVEQQPPSWHETWGKIREALEHDVSELNGHGGPQFTIPRTAESLIYVVPKQGPVESAVIQITDPRAGMLQLDCPIARPGTPRRSEFTMSEGKILLKRHITGQPVPPSKSMTPEEFSRYILEPIFFPS
jgi:hypothetical protein